MTDVPPKRTDTGELRTLVPVETTAQKALVIFNAVLLVFCVGLIVTYITELATRTSDHPNSDPGLCVFLLGIAIICGWWLRKRWRERRSVSQLYQEQSILRSLKGNRSGLTIAQAAIDCKLPIAETRIALDKLTTTGVCQVDVSEEGELIYKLMTPLLGRD